MIASYQDVNEFIKSLEDLKKGFKDKTLDCQHGIVVTLGFSFARKSLTEMGEKERTVFWESLRF